MEVPFVHLHCHSHYSLLDGAGKIKALIKRAKALGMPALAITDHGNLYGAIEFYQEAKKEGINPIIGYEAYIARGCRTDKTAAKQREAHNHLTLLAINHEGYKNLIKLASIAHIEGFYYKPRIDKETLEKHNEGLICLSGCASSEISRLITEETDDSFDKAKAVAEWYKELFGDRYYLEVQNHGLEFQKTIREGIQKLSQTLKIPIAATNDVHYIYPEDDNTQDMLLCVGRNEQYNDPKRRDPSDFSDQFFFKSGIEMKRALPGLEDAIAETVKIAERVKIDLDLSKRYFPVFTPPNGISYFDMYQRYV
jgi:DNA polymerase-3 subunit alpha